MWGCTQDPGLALTFDGRDRPVRANVTPIAVGSMPFTPAHILAIVPIARIKRPRLPLSALVIGSMIPDFPLFVPLPPDYRVTHSPPGVLTACLPLGLATLLVFQFLMKRPLFALLPVWIQRRCLAQATSRVEPGPMSVTVASVAVMVGACTHLIWDSFTHRGRWGTQLFPVLNETVMTIGSYDVPGFKLLQYGSTLVGLTWLLLLLGAWLARQTPVPLESLPHSSRATRAVAYLVAVGVPIVVAVDVRRREDLSSYERLGQSITTSGLALMAVSLGYCLAFAALERRRVGSNR